MPGNLYLAGENGGRRRCAQSDQRDFVDQRQLPADYPGVGHGRRDRGQLPDIQSAGQGRHQRVPRIAGIEREHDFDRRAARRRGARPRGAEPRVRAGDRHGRDRRNHAGVRSGDSGHRGREHAGMSGHRRQTVRHAGPQRDQRGGLRAGGQRDQYLVRSQGGESAQGAERDSRLLFPVRIPGAEPVSDRDRAGRRFADRADPFAAGRTAPYQCAQNQRRRDFQFATQHFRPRGDRPFELQRTARKRRDSQPRRRRYGTRSWR